MRRLIDHHAVAFGAENAATALAEAAAWMAEHLSDVEVPTVSLSYADDVPRFEVVVYFTEDAA